VVDHTAWLNSILGIPGLDVPWRMLSLLVLCFFGTGLAFAPLRHAALARTRSSAAQFPDELEPTIDRSFIPTVNTFDPDKINPESFHGFLMSEFVAIVGDARGQIELDQFYTWKSSNGIVFTKEEVAELWESILGSPTAPCSLEKMIEINRIIDEQL